MERRFADEANQPKPDVRAGLILDRLFQGPTLPDIVFLQEVHPRARESVLDHPGVRSSFLTTDAEDAVSFKDVPFATMTLLSSRRFFSPLLADEKSESETGESSPKLALDSVFRTPFPSRYKQDALCVSIAAPGAPGTSGKNMAGMYRYSPHIPVLPPYQSPSLVPCIPQYERLVPPRTGMLWWCLQPTRHALV